MSQLFWKAVLNSYSFMLADSIVEQTSPCLYLVILKLIYLNLQTNQTFQIQ